MKTVLSLACILVLCLTSSFIREGALTARPLLAQAGQAQGKSIGTIMTLDNLIVFELNDGSLGHANLFDLEQRTLRFTPGPGGYRLENVALQWNADSGAAMTGSQATLKNFTFPFSGKTW